MGLREEIMRTNILRLMAAACFLAWPGPAKNLPRPVQIPPGEGDVTVYVAHACRMPEAVQKIAEDTVSVLFERIGISVRFTSTEPAQTDTETIALRVWERAPGGLQPHVLGSAWMDRKHGRQANVFYDRLTEFYGDSGLQETGRILGYAIAHEMGHVLRADSGHSYGVMKACWRQRDIMPMLQQSVGFTRADAERIHAMMAERRRLVLAREEEN